MDPFVWIELEYIAIYCQMDPFVYMEVEYIEVHYQLSLFLNMEWIIYGDEKHQYLLNKIMKTNFIH